MKKSKRRNSIDFPILVIFIILPALFLFGLILYRVSFLALSKEVDGINLKELASKRTTRTTTISAKRGTIYASNNDALVQTVSSYTLIAYLDSNRTINEKKPQHVVDKERTAKELATVIDMDEETILNYLKKENVYQTEFGKAGKGLSELQKNKIDALNLPGIDFIENYKRYYPKGDFASYILGYAKTNDDGTIKGEMGIEKYYDDLLSGEDGYIKYQKDLKGYQIAGTPVLKQDAQQGKDVYLTIDSNIQFYIEQALKNSNANYGWEWFTFTVADAKTGAILGTANSPSFDPNVRNITNYLDMFVASPYEPGSTMKTFTYMAAMENGVYDGNEVYESGTFTTTDGTEIGDWNRNGWGTITFDKGYALSSNVGVINIINRHMNSLMLRQYYKKLGFGKKTRISLPNEQKGKLDFRYETEIYNAGFGQGILVTPVQMIQAMSSITNDGMLLKPYIVKKIVNPENGEVILENKKEEVERVASTGTVQKMMSLMDDCVNGYGNTGSGYRIDGGELIGKTGTSQIADEHSSGYLTGEEDIISSFAGVYPKSDPQIIIYAAVKRPSGGSQKSISNAVKEVVSNYSKYKGNADTKTNTIEIKTYEVENYLNKKTDSIKTKLDSEGVHYQIIGNGNKIIKQSPREDTKITSKDTIYLITNDKNLTVPDVNGLSGKVAKSLLEELGLKVNIDGVGYVTGQSVAPGTPITKGLEIILNLNPKFQADNPQEQSEESEGQ